MGSEVSNMRPSSAKPQSSNACSPKTRHALSSGTPTNNLPAILFHPVHGENIRISSDGTSARRSESFCKGIAFSNRPVRVGERVCIRFAELSVAWSGALRFGFTSNDPSTHRHALPKYACPDLTNKPGNWAKALSERFAQTDAMLTYYVSESGDVRYAINGEDKGVFFSGVSTTGPLWALVDVYGNTTCVEFVDARLLLNNRNRSASQPALNVNTEAPSNLVTHFSQLTVSESNREPLPAVYSKANFTPMPFHRTRGCNVRLSNDRCVAERNDSHYCQGYTFTQRPLRIGEKLVLQVLQTDELYAGSIAFGLTTCDPNSITGSDLPEDPHQLLDRPEYWVVIKDVANGPQPGDEIAFKITPTGKVQLFKNRQQPVTLMHVDASQKFHAFFDLYGSTIKIKALGTVSERNTEPARQYVPRNSMDDLSFIPNENSNNYARVGNPCNRSTEPAVASCNSQSTSAIYSTPLNVNVNASPRVALSPIRGQTLPSRQRLQAINGRLPSMQGLLQEVPLKTKVVPSPHSPTYSALSSARSVASSAGNSGSLSSISNECTVCYEQPINSVLYMCGHMCMCYECAFKQWKGQGGGHCPICRATILDVIKTYYA